MPKAKFDRIKMNQLLRSGKSQKEVAQFFGVSEGAISKAKKELNVAVIKDVALEAAHKVVESDLDLMAQMRKVSRVINERLEQSQQDVLKTDGADKRAIEKIMIEQAAEVRKQVETILHIAEAWDIHKRFGEFQRSVLDAIGRQHPEVRAEIVEDLRQAGFIRSSVQLRP